MRSFVWFIHYVLQAAQSSDIRYDVNELMPFCCFVGERLLFEKIATNSCLRFRMMRSDNFSAASDQRAGMDLRCSSISSNEYTLSTASTETVFFVPQYLSICEQINEETISAVEKSISQALLLHLPLWINFPLWIDRRGVWEILTLKSRRLVFIT